MATAHSFWAQKPWWCQPWTIVLTGSGVIAASWWLSQRWWITLPLTGAVLLWWFLFLVLVPGNYEAPAVSDTQESPAERPGP